MTATEAPAGVTGVLSLEDAAERLERAERVLVAAGAGLSAAAGYDYADEARFAELFPALRRAGLRTRFDAIYRHLPARLQWGFWAVHVTDIRFGSGANPLYRQLRSLLDDRDHAVLTSNADGLFARNGFDAARVHAPQGDYALYQCLRPCTREVFDARPVLARALELYDPETGETATDGVPTCPRCGGPVFLHLHAGPWFVHEVHERTGARLSEWIRAAVDDPRPTVVLEVGAGLSTPGVVRWPAEAVARAVPGAALLRLSRDDATVPVHLADQAASLDGDAAVVLDRLSRGSGASAPGDLARPG